MEHHHNQQNIVFLVDYSKGGPKILSVASPCSCAAARSFRWKPGCTYTVATWMTAGIANYPSVALFQVSEIL
jgi:hypothetical protein